MRSERVKAVFADNKKKQLTVVYSSGQEVVAHYGQLGIKRSIESARPDKETRGRSIVIQYGNGDEDVMPYDQPLAAVRDPEFILRRDLELITAQIRRDVAAKGISLRYLARQLGTSDNQIQRLLNPGILNKNLGQLYKIAMLLGLKVEIKLGEAA